VDHQIWNKFGEDGECLSNTIAGKAPIEGEESSTYVVEEGAFARPGAGDGGFVRHRLTIANVEIDSGAAKVLIVIPTLGTRAQYLRSTIESIKAQQVPASIVIVGPTDSPVIRQVSASFDIPVVADPGSLPGAINAGIKDHAAGHDFVGWLNDDDYLEPGSLAATTQALVRNPQAVVAYGACRYVDAEGRELWISSAGKWAERALSWGPDLIPQPGMLVRAEAWQVVGGLDVSYRLAFDLDLLLRLRKVGDFINTGTVVSNFRWHPESLTVDNRAVNFAESERAKRSALSPWARRLAPLWEPPVRWATRMAVWEVDRRARKRLEMASLATPAR